MPEVPLTELMTAIGLSVNEAQKAIEEQAVSQYCSYFASANADGGGEPSPLEPGLMRFAVPRPDGNGIHKEVTVPNVTMMPHKLLNLETVRVSLALTSCRMEGGSLRVEVDGQGRAANAAADEPARTGKKDDFVVSPSECRYPFAGRHGSAIEMVFRHAPPAEGIRRLNLEQVKII